MEANIVTRLLGHAANTPVAPALWYRNGSRWEQLTWRGYADRCRAFAGGLVDIGHEPGDAVAIVGDNSAEWLIADVGAMTARGVPTGIYQTSTAEQLAYVAQHCNAKVIVAQNKAQWDKIAAVRDQLPDLKRVVLIEDTPGIDDPLVVSFDSFCEAGAAHLEVVDQRIAAIEPTDLATLIYTSGTTGHPKGVMLSANNLAETAEVAVEMVGGVKPDSCVVSYLPLSHIAEQMFSIHVAITAGYPIWICQQLEQLKETLIDAHPTHFLAVPRVWEKFRAALEQKFADAPPLKRAIIQWSRSVVLAVGQRRLSGASIDPFLQLKHKIADKLFVSKLTKQLGLDKLTVALSGAAPIGADVLEFFLSCGIPIYEVYGQSEGTGPTTFNRPAVGQTKIGTVGRPIPRCEVRIAEDGEVLVRGPNVFMGYYRDEAATAETLIDGWLHSGDVGEFDSDGFLRITDRKKDLIITAGGKNVAPQNIEKLLRNIPGVSQAVVIGDRRKYLSALLTLDPVGAGAVARQNSWPDAPGDLAAHDGFLSHIQHGVDNVNQELARYETIKKWKLLAEDFTLETGELTPTQKIKRRVVTSKFNDQIEGLYAE